MEYELRWQFAAGWLAAQNVTSHVVTYEEIDTFCAAYCNNPQASTLTRKFKEMFPNATAKQL